MPGRPKKAPKKSRPREEVEALLGEIDHLVELEDPVPVDEQARPGLEARDEASYVRGVKDALEWVLGRIGIPSPVERLYGSKTLDPSQRRPLPQGGDVIQQLDKEGKAKLRRAGAWDPDVWNISRSVFEHGIPAAIQSMRMDVGLGSEEEAWETFEARRRELLDFAVLTSLQNSGGTWKVANPKKRWEEGLALPSDAIGAQAGHHVDYWINPHCPVCGNSSINVRLEKARARPEQVGTLAMAECTCGTCWLERFELGDIFGDAWKESPDRDELAAYENQHYCKQCNSHDVRRYDLRRETEGNDDGCPVVVQDAECIDCGDDWIERYGLTGVRIWQASWSPRGGA